MSPIVADYRLLSVAEVRRQTDCEDLRLRSCTLFVEEDTGTCSMMNSHAISEETGAC